jgi:hypothetical protein
MLAKMVRDFFANGGGRCWVVNVADRIEQSESQILMNEMFGLVDHKVPHGLEQLLRQDEVSIIVLPELDARIEEITPHVESQETPGPSCFVKCADIDGPLAAAQLPPQLITTRRLYTNQHILWAQRYLISRLQREHWRWFAILAPPQNRDPAQAVDWRQELTHNLEECQCAALYWPWVLSQAKPGAPVETLSPVGCIAGVFARRDLARGPHVAPANERLRTVVGLERNIDDGINGTVYDRGVNVIRSFAGRGTMVWGARTLLWETQDSRANPLAFVSGRRCLSAIERMAERIGQQAVFEPHSPLLRMQVSQAITGYLVRIFEVGALQGTTPEEAFYVRCDTSNNPQASVEQGQLICEVGVALAAPAEFIVFRVGRQEGLTEIEEVG